MARRRSLKASLNAEEIQGPGVKVGPSHASGSGVLICDACAAPLSAPVCRLTDARLVDIEGWAVRVPQRTWAAAVEVPGRPAKGRVWIHPHDLIVAQVVPSGFGCCGYFPTGSEYNLCCRCGAGVGTFVDECSYPIEVALDPVWAEGGDAPSVPDGMEQRLARLDPAHWQGRPGRCTETTYWKVELDPYRRAAKDVEIHLRRRPGGETVELVADGVSRQLAMSSLDLARAVGLLALPIGDPALTVVHQELGPDNRVLETWGLVRRGEEVDLHRERDGKRDTVVVWEEWLTFAWERAVEEWMSSAGR